MDAPVPPAASFSSASGRAPVVVHPSMDTITESSVAPKGYQHLQVDLSGGSLVESASFIAGGYPWKLLCYPNGLDELSAGFLSVFVVLDEEVSYDVKAYVELGFKEIYTSLSFFSIGKMERVMEVKPIPVISSDYKDSFPTSGPIPYDEERRYVRFSSYSQWGSAKFYGRTALKESNYVMDGLVTIRCDIKVENLRQATYVSPSTGLYHNLRTALDRGLGTDLTFEVGGQKFQAHKLIVGTYPVFDAAMSGPMKERDDVIVINDMDPAVFKIFLEFMYTDHLPKFDDNNEVAIYEHLLVAADKYGVDRLKKLCEDVLSRSIDEESVGFILALAEQHHCICLKNFCLEYLSRVPDLLVARSNEGLEHLRTICPDLLNEILSDAMVVAPARLGLAEAQLDEGN